MSMIKQIRTSTEYSRARNERVYEFLGHMFALAGSFLPAILQEHLNVHNTKKQAIRQIYASMNVDANTASDIWRAQAVDCLMTEVRFNQKLLHLMRQYRNYLLECDLFGVPIPDCPTSWIYQDFPILRSKSRIRTQSASVLCEFVLAKYDLKKDSRTARLILAVEQESKSPRHQSIKCDKQPLVKSEPSIHNKALTKASVEHGAARKCTTCTVTRDSPAPCAYQQNIQYDSAITTPAPSLPQSNREETVVIRVLNPHPGNQEALEQSSVDRSYPSTSQDQPIKEYYATRLPDAFQPTGKSYPEIRYCTEKSFIKGIDQAELGQFPVDIISPSASEEQLFKESCAYRLQDEFYEYQSPGEQCLENRNCSEEPVVVIGDDIHGNQAVLGHSPVDIISPSASEEKLFKEQNAYSLQDEFYEHQAIGEQYAENRNCSEEPVRVIGDEVHGNQAVSCRQPVVVIGDDIHGNQTVLGHSPVDIISPSASEEQLFKEHCAYRLQDEFYEHQSIGEQCPKHKNCSEEPVILVMCDDVPVFEQSPVNTISPATSEDQLFKNAQSDFMKIGEESDAKCNHSKQNIANEDNQKLCGLDHFYGNSPVTRIHAETDIVYQDVPTCMSLTPHNRQQSDETRNYVEDLFVVESSEQSSLCSNDSQSDLVIISDDSDTNISYYQESVSRASSQCHVVSIDNASVDLPDEAVADFSAEVDTSYMRDSNGHSWAAYISDDRHTNIPVSLGYYSVSPDEHAFHSCNIPKTRQSSTYPDHQNIMTHCEDTIQGNETFMKYTGGNCVFGFRDALKRKADNDEGVPYASANKRNKPERTKPKKVAVRQIITYDTATRDYSDFSVSGSIRVPAFRDPQTDTRAGNAPSYRESRGNINIDVHMGTDLIDDDEADDEVEGLCMSGGPPIYREIDGDRYQYRVPQSLIVPEWHQAQAPPHRMGPCKAVDIPTYIDNISGHCLKYPEPAEGQSTKDSDPDETPRYAASHLDPNCLRKFTSEPSQLAVKVPCRRPSVEQVFQPI